MSRFVLKCDECNNNDFINHSDYLECSLCGGIIEPMEINFYNLKEEENSCQE